VEEVRSLHLRYTRCQEIYFEIETFGVNKKWAACLCNELILLNATLERPFSFGVNLRIVPKIDYTELLTLCKKSNFKYINIGLESGSERLRREVLNRNYENKDIINAVKTAQSLGLEVQLYNMIGLPTETLEDFKATVELNRICQPDRHSTAIFFLIREQNFTHSVLKKGLSPGILIQNLNVSSPF